VRKFEARWGGCLVVDVSNGDILAWAQYPFFNPNKVADTPAADRKNRLATDMLEQGSTIKSFLLASALQEGVVNRDTVINCENGKWKFGRRILHDTHPYGKLNVEQILHVSSNIGAAKIGLELGAEKYYSYLNRLGFGVPTGLPLAGESRGILRNYRRWADIDLATASFGQSFSTTMVQMAQAYLCLAGDGVKRPLRLVLDDEPYGADPTLGNARSWDGASVALAHATAPGQSDAMRAVGEQPMRIFSPRTTSAIRAMLREVVEVEGGTGKQARIPGIEVGGKTGTAQKADASGRYGSGRVGSFVGMVPIDKPRFLVYVLLDEPTRSQYGGVIAAPVFRHVGMNTMAYHGLLPNRELEPEQADVAVAANRQNGKTPPAAPAPALKTAREAQRQKAPETRPDQRVVNADNDALVPTVVGMGLRNAVEAFAQRGIVPTIKGRGGIVSRQTPESGSPWPSGGAKCILWMEEDS
jgi:cell division protein FtsI (penicillin-binding protein 3)